VTDVPLIGWDVFNTNGDEDSNSGGEVAVGIIAMGWGTVEMLFGDDLSVCKLLEGLTSSPRPLHLPAAESRRSAWFATDLYRGVRAAEIRSNNVISGIADGQRAGSGSVMLCQL